ncbi:DNA primase small subunit [Phyllosticta citrichinensis]|uniref:DNA primase n=1 Tax=Phyllosticta citrichinensis TaxID=1130410 RepID=A0ABR1XPK7_9PEZI
MPHSVSPEKDDIELPDAPSGDASADNSQAPPPSSPPINTLADDEALEEMLDAEDSDDEFTSSAQTQQPQANEVQSSPEERFTDPEIMRAFYQRLFPFRYLFQWLNHSPSPTNDFGHREFAFTLQNDVYLRYQSFPTADLFRKQCIQMTPSRFEIGPVYSTNPRDRKTLSKVSAFRPISKELVFDIDMTDYDEIRTCCKGANICKRCWTFITMAIKVVDVALKEDFGFKHVLWVYSGRRGAHAWVCDKRARDLDDQKRRSIAGYLELLKGGSQGGKRVNVRRPLHPHLERSLNMLREHFQNDVLYEQDPWATPEKFNHLLGLLPDKKLAEALKRKWESAPSRPSSQKWADIDSLASSGASSTLDTKALKEAKQDILLEYTYPRLDAEVSKKLNHLLKSPFCVHPGTGRICVPIDTRSVDEFDPLEVPKVSELLNEIDKWDKENAGKMDEDAAKKIPDWEKTRLKGYVDFFRGFVTSVLKEEQSAKRTREDSEGMEF